MSLHCLKWTVREADQRSQTQLTNIITITKQDNQMILCRKTHASTYELLRRRRGTTVLPPAAVMHATSPPHVAYFSEAGGVRKPLPPRQPVLSAALLLSCFTIPLERASSVVRIVATMAAQRMSEDGGVVDADMREGAPTAPVSPQARLAIHEIKSEIISELMWHLQDSESPAAALATQTKKIEAIRSALQVRAGIQSRAEAELGAATEHLSNTMDVYKLFRGVSHTFCFVLDRDNRVTAVKSADEAFAVARRRQALALESVDESHALHAQLDRRLQMEEIKLELLNSAFTFSGKLLLHAIVATRFGPRRRAR